MTADDGSILASLGITPDGLAPPEEIWRAVLDALDDDSLPADGSTVPEMDDHPVLIDDELALDDEGVPNDERVPDGSLGNDGLEGTDPDLGALPEEFEDDLFSAAHAELDPAGGHDEPPLDLDF